MDDEAGAATAAGSALSARSRSIEIACGWQTSPGSALPHAPIGYRPPSSPDTALTPDTNGRR